MGSASLEIHHVQIHEVQRIGLMELELARAPLVESRQKICHLRTFPSHDPSPPSPKLAPES